MLLTNDSIEDLQNEVTACGKRYLRNGQWTDDSSLSVEAWIRARINLLNTRLNPPQPLPLHPEE